MNTSGFHLVSILILVLCSGCVKDKDAATPAPIVSGSQSMAYTASLDMPATVLIRSSNTAWTQNDQLLSLQIPGGVLVGDKVTVLLQTRLTKPGNCNVTLSLAGILRFDMGSLPSDPDNVDVTNSLVYDYFPAVNGIQYFNRVGTHIVQETRPEAHVGVWLIPFAFTCSGSNLVADQVTLTVLVSRG